jgi:hypothetical protein
MLTVVPALAFQLARQYERADDFELSELLSGVVDMVYRYQGGALASATTTSTIA